jgi:ribonucleotide reductase alpha subunit
MMLVPRADFTLNPSFLATYAATPPKFGALGEITYLRTYSLELPDGSMEAWWQTCARVVEGTYRIQKGHCLKHNLPWNDEKAQRSAQDMYARMFNFKFLPPGRGLSKMGTEIMFKIGGACLNNCGFRSTKDIGNPNIKDAFASPFVWLMSNSMVGVGVGFDTKGAGSVKIIKPVIKRPHTVEDSREGWCDYLRLLLQSYVDSGVPFPIADYSQVRPKGAKIKGFGGTASGPEALATLTDRIVKLGELYADTFVDSRYIVDVANAVGECVVAGGVRRTAEIGFGEPDDEQFLNLKNYVENKEASEWPRWASNNSVSVDEYSNFERLAQLTVLNGEPGYLFLKNAQRFGRMADPPNDKDHRALGANPCQPAFATVLTPTGISTVGDIKIGDTVWSGRQWTKVTNKWSTGVKEVFEYHTRAGVFIGTENHRVVSNGEKVEVKHAEAIDVCQGPVMPTVAPLNVEDVMDGLVVGDGSRRSPKTRDLPHKQVLLHVGDKDQSYFTSEIKELIIDKYASEKSYIVRTTITPEELPELSQRCIPERFHFGDTLKTRGFLRGLYSANGSVINNRITLKTTSKQLLLQVQEMLSALGIRTYYTTNKPHTVTFPNGTYTCVESYDLNISTDRDKFQALIGFIQPYKNEKLAEVNARINVSPYAHSRPKTTYEIVDVKMLGEMEVFDLTVDAEEHTYWTGGLLVSNCMEQTLEDFELCCLVETFPSNCDDYEDYQRTLKMAYLYAKTVTLVPTQSPETNAVMLRNRRIGCSQSGIQDNIEKIGLRNHLDWCDKGYNYIQKLDVIYSDWLCIPRSIKTTSIKPSGCRPWDALTSTDKGIFTLQELFEDHEDNQQWSPVKKEIFAQQGATQSRITRTYVNGESELIKLTLSYGIELLTTPNHQWYVASNYDHDRTQKMLSVNDWVRADKICLGDIIEFKLGSYTKTEPAAFKRLNAAAIKMRCDHAPITQPTHMSEDIAWMLGYLWGDGAMSPNHYRIRFIDQNEEHLYKCQRIIYDNFGVTANIVKCSDRDASAFDISSKYLWHWLIKNDIYKYHADNLDIIPKVVRESSRDHILAFIAGLIDSDGCVSQLADRCKITLASAEDLFAKHLQEVAWSVGLGFGRSLNSLGSNWQVKRKHMWLLTLSQHVTPEAHAVLMRNSCKMAGKGPWHHEVCTHNRLFPGKVLKIEHIQEKQPTYDIEVENTHWYYAGAFKSHNTVSKLVGLREGIHESKGEYELQAIRLNDDSPIIPRLIAANYRVEKAVNERNTVVAYFPMHYPRTRKRAPTMWEQLELAALMQAHWADNQVSISVDFDKESEGPEIGRALTMYAHRLKGVSFFPREDHGYVQPPKTVITKEEYDAYTAQLKPLDLSNLSTHEVEDRFCDGGTCEVVFK